MRGKLGSVWIEMKNANFKRDGRDAPDIVEEMDEEKGIFAAGEGNQNPVVVFDEIPWNRTLRDGARDFFMKLERQAGNACRDVTRLVGRGSEGG